VAEAWSWLSCPSSVVLRNAASYIVTPRTPSYYSQVHFYILKKLLGWFKTWCELCNFYGFMDTRMFP